ncbi:SMI1/KNR4 family protein [Cellvibrio japonicus]|uniref:SMI1/KNR4 family protein n=1 Tax=Cellvibrio japonicus TaxID=155077 RepID=UPI00165338B7|nr:SMI1/KNR4 family protein [Cellvibrio japonicus]
MDKIFFNEKILGPLKGWAHLGETQNDMGTQLIGHAPHIAPRAYVNVVYPPLNNRDFDELTQILGREIPEQFKAFLSFANGLMIFSGSLRVMGYTPIKKKSNADVYDYPSSVTIPNVSARINGTQGTDVVVAWYKSDGSYVLLNEVGKAIRFSAKDGVHVIKEWPDFDTWLSSEIAVLNEKYKAGEISVFIPSKIKGS